jgi:hypothetical protein
MTVHELYPSWVKMSYTSLGRQKHAIYPCAIAGTATPGVEPDFTTRDSGNLPATECLANWVAAIDLDFNTSDSFDSFEVYHKAAIDADPVFIYGAPLGLPGTSAAADVAYSEAVWTFKTPTAGGLKIYLMETIIPVDNKTPLPATGNPVVNDPAAFILSADNWIIGRNGDFPLLGLFMTSKQNDYYRRKYKL